MAELNKHDMGPEAASGGGGGGSRGGRICGMDRSYVVSMNGILKGNQVGWSFIAFILSCLGGPDFFHIIFAIIMFIGFFVSASVFIIFAFSLDKKISKINMYLADLVVGVLGTIIYFAFCLPMVILRATMPVMLAAGLLGFLGMAGYFVSIWFCFKRWRQNRSRGSSGNQATS